ncbi:MAG: glycosyltransferase [Polyangiaceae bacterium]
MARFLFVVPPLVGHTNPTVSVARALEARGHEVAWVAHPRAVRPLLPANARLVELDDHVPEQRWAEANAKARAVRGLAAFQFLWEEFFVPLAHSMMPGVERAVDAIAPDVLVVDQQALAGAMIARKRGLGWATFATTSAGLTDPLAGLPRVRAWLDAQIASLEGAAGLAPVAEPDRSPHLVIAFTTPALMGGAATFADHVHFVGPAIAERPENAPFPFEALREVPRVLVSLGTVNFEVGERFYNVAVEALENEPIQVVMVAPVKQLARVPDNFLVRPFVPQLALLPHMQAVVSHGGHNTVAETLWNGLPLVVLPIKDDQPVVAEQVASAGAGIRLKFGRVRPDELRDAVRRVLAEPSFREAAARVQASFREAGGAGRAADLLARLSASKLPVSEQAASQQAVSQQATSAPAAHLGEDPC